MTFPNIFSQPVVEQLITRIDRLTPESKPGWGKMKVAQMLAHSAVAYEMVYEDKHPKPNFFVRWILKSFIKKTVVGAAPYPKNSRTAPAFLITEEKDFEKEKRRLVGFLEKTQRLGESHFNGKESLSLGKLTTDEWNTMFYKHLDHHLTQFGV